MIAPTHRRPNGLDAELDALVAREVDALAARKARLPNGKAADDQVAADEVAPGVSTQDLPPAAMPAGARRPNDRAGRGPRSGSAATNVIGIRHGSAPAGPYGLPFSADEEAFIEEAVAFLRHRGNADVILDEIWSHAVVSRDEDDERIIEEDVETAQRLDDDAPTSDAHPRDDDGAPAPERNRTAPASARRSAGNIREQSASAHDATPPAIHAPPPGSGKASPANDPDNEEPTP